MKYLSLILLSFATLTTNAATYYRWVDANGTPHYSQYAPTNGVDLRKVEVVNARYLGPATQPAGGDNGQPVYLNPEQQRIAELEAQNKAQQQEQDKERCKALQNNLSNLNAGGRIYEMDPSGERKYLDGRAIELKRQQAQQAINQFCK